MAADQLGVAGLALDQELAVWNANASPGPGHEIRSMTLATSSVSSIANEAVDIRAFALDAVSIYYSTFDILGAVRSVPRGGGTPTTLLDQLTFPRRPAVADGQVFASTGDGLIVSAPVSGGARTVVADLQGQALGNIAIDGDRIYFATLGPKASFFMVGTNGQGLAKIADSDPELTSNDIAVDAGYLYFASTHGVMRLAKP